MSPDISVVLPMRDEAANLERALELVTAQLEALGRTFEIICIDDGSVDATTELLEQAVRRDERVRAVHFTRNFGKEAALAAGLDVASGQAVILLDADLQHPPDLIPSMVRKWEEGFDVVEAVKSVSHGNRSRSFGYRFGSAAFYALMGTAARERLDGSSDFKLLDRQVVDTLCSFPERNRFFRGLVAWVGFRVARLPFEVQQRTSGSTRWSLAQLVRYAVRNVVSFSSAPLRFVAWMGFIILFLAVALGVNTFWHWYEGTAVTGFTTVILAVLGLGGLILLSLGIVAAYLAQMYDEQKARPVYVVRRPRSAGKASTEE